MSLWMLSSSFLSMISSSLLIVCSMSYECLLALFYSNFGMIFWYPPLTVHVNRLGTCSRMHMNNQKSVSLDDFFCLRVLVSLSCHNYSCFVASMIMTIIALSFVAPSLL